VQEHRPAANIDNVEAVRVFYLLPADREIREVVT
jgi:hypothetical protein